jgi:sugar phosphate isomerase/epimerase
MERREFLIGTALALGAAGRTSAQGGAAARPVPSQAILNRLAIMTYSFQRILKAPNAAPSPDRVLEFFDMPEMLADRYKVHNVEVQHTHFASTETSFFKDFLGRLAKVKSRVSNINLELGTMNISSPDPILRTQAVDLTKRWIDHAAVLGSPRVMINQGPLTDATKDVAIDALSRMTAYAKTKNIRVGMETRGNGPAQQPGEAPRRPAYEVMAAVIKATGAWSNPDVGNYGGDQAFQHAGMRVLFPLHGGNCHMKMHTPPRYDLVAAINLTKELRYNGLYSIEFEGQGDNYEGVQAVFDLLVANL